MRRRLVQPAASAVLAVLALLTTSCAAGKDAAPSASGGGSKITLGFSAWPGWFPWQVAQEKGLFAKNGVQVELKYFDNYTDSLNALATGNIDANSQTLNDTLASAAGGAKETVVLVNDNSTGNDQIIARDGVKTLADLKGRTVAAEQGTVDHYLLLLALRKAGLTERDVKFQPLPTDAAAAAFVAGQVDAVGVFAPFTTTALKRPGSTAISSSADFPGAIPDHLVVTRDLLDRDAESVQALVNTWFDTLAWISANRDEALAIMAKRAGVGVADYETYDKGTSIFTLEQNRAAFASDLPARAKQIADFLVAGKLVDAAPSLDGLLDARFVQAVQP
ncbi:aliphatic sulfonate ABC transporter substrate-binding protein [Sphaerisporangium album]|uniref:Aliphatic sulfonate ABC transporter substrate-binding protein n=1 Tax=Sphaerisporangium album TaxID=509200 RepID=A0A367FJE5_9ACTN|nr:ABC transporter substrate-binding protein [Sphaerisporangium album]RCG30506.1 aliphatic sulfonate ABC transporter substrate-binding protein [Sphaerisporangium album]